MSLYLGLNRRTAGDRRVLDRGEERDRRAGERRRAGSDRYVLILGPIGVDRWGLMLGFPAALVIAYVLIGVLVRAWAGV